MERPKVSVIIPLYNTEDYIGDTLDSIRNQTLREIEIIVINDGSTDEGPHIVEMTAKNDLRIRQISQINQGLSSARNAGINNASGEYIYFMDSDDLLDTDTLELCYNKCIHDNLDLLFFDADVFGIEGYFDNRYYNRTHLIENKIYNGTDILSQLISKSAFRSSACLYITRLDYLQRINLQFFKIRKHEDELFTPQLFIHADRVGLIPRAFFKRRMRANSIMTTTFSRANMECYFTVAKNILTIFDKETEAKKDIITRFVSNMLNAAIWRAHKLPLKDKVWCAGVIAARYMQYIKLKNIGVLMFKQ